jgi:hypothetical protein
MSILEIFIFIYIEVGIFMCVYLYCSRCGEVALVLSSENKLYVLLIGIAGDESGQITKFLLEV